MSKNMLIMCEDTVVYRVNFDTLLFEVVSEDLLPFTMKGKMKELLTFDRVRTRYELTQSQVAIDKNKEAIISWLANRTLSLSRKNAKWIYNLLRFEQVNSNEQKAKIAITCRAVSLLDNYWLKLEDDPVTWAGVNLRHNKLNEVIAQVALHGKSLTLQGSLTTPELTTNGAYAKAWRRHPDESLWLYKLGMNGNTESRIEVMCSNLLDKMSVVHCHYEAGKDDGKYVCMCPCMANDNLSILPGLDFYTYCNVHGLNPASEMMQIDADSICKMWIVDYLLCNRDRHGQNWGFYYKPVTMEIIGCHPLFDHNNAFDLDYMKDREAPYQFGEMTIRQAAKFAMSKVDFYFTEEITREDFITARQYNEFMWRAKDLGVETRPSPYEAKVRRAMSKTFTGKSYEEVMELIPKCEVEEEEIEHALRQLS